jgi:hypothetical protein
MVKGGILYNKCSCPEHVLCSFLISICVIFYLFMSISFFAFFDVFS